MVYLPIFASIIYLTEHKLPKYTTALIQITSKKKTRQDKTKPKAQAHKLFLDRT